MSEILITLLRLSVMGLVLAAKGNPGGIVQQQIETMGLRQWLSLVSLWLVERAYSELAAIRVSSEASQNNSVNNSDFFLLGMQRMRTAGVDWPFRACGDKGCVSCAFPILNCAHEIEFNLLNRYLIVPATPEFIFDQDGKRVPRNDTATSSQPRAS